MCAEPAACLWVRSGLSTTSWVAKPPLPPIKLMAHPHMPACDAAQRRVLTHDSHVAGSAQIPHTFRSQTKIWSGSRDQAGIWRLLRRQKRVLGCGGESVVVVANNRLGLWLGYYYSIIYGTWIQNRKQKAQVSTLPAFTLNKFDPSNYGGTKEK